MFRKLETQQLERELSAIDCNKLTIEDMRCNLAVANRDNGWMASHFNLPRISYGKFTRLLPHTPISGRVLNEEFWTDGAILLRCRKQADTDFYVKFSAPLAPMLELGERVRWLCRLSNVSLNKRAFVYMRSENYAMLVQERYLEIALIEAGYNEYKHRIELYKDDAELYFNKQMTGCVLYRNGEVLSYISMYRPPIRMFIKIQALSEEWHANCRH